MDGSVVKKVSISGQAGTSSDNKEQPTEEQTNSSLRRLACDACRARKVRCDRRNPPCSRCAKVGTTCRYSSRSKPTPSKMDLSRFLMTLNNRLEQAEAQLALGPLIQNPQSFATPWGDVDMGPAVSTSSPSTTSPRPVSPPQISSAHPSTHDLHKLGIPTDKVMVQQTVAEWSDRTGSGDFQLDTFTSTISADLLQAQTVPDRNQAFDFDSIFLDISSSSTSQAVPAISANLLQGLYDQYFNIFHPIMPIINRTRFQTEMSQASPSIEVQVLSYAIGALSAFSMPELRGYVEKCYEEARNLLDLCERQESSDSLTNINILQACALLTLYEFKRPNFTRAWMTLGRAIRLAKIMGLDKIDGHSSISAQWSPRMQLPLPSNPADLEERHRTFWLLYILDAFASLRTNSGPSFDRQIAVPLPSSSEFPDFTKASDNMPSLQQVFELSEKILLSSFAGSTIMISLYQRCFDHIQSSFHESSHAFWETHYRIDKAINHCRTSLLAQHVKGHSSDDPPSVTLRMNLNAVEINLHEAALVKVQKDELPAGLAAEAISKCVAAATDIVEAVQQGQRLTGNKLETFRQLDQFIVWPITTAIQVCFRMLYHGEDDVTPYINFLRILSSSMKDLIDPEHIAPGLLEKADARVAEAERSTKKRWALED